MSTNYTFSVHYTLKRSARAKYMKLSVHPGGEVVLTAPRSMTLVEIERFVTSKHAWLARSVARMRQMRALPVSLAGRAGRRAYLQHKEESRKFILGRLSYWNQAYRFSYSRIAIKNTKRLWGSCSRKGNLNFSYTLLFLPRELADYVIVHELCHLKEHNHSPRFWALVRQALPDFGARRAELRRYTPSR